MANPVRRRIWLGLLPILTAAAAGSIGCFGDILGSDNRATVEEPFEFKLEVTSQLRLRVDGENGDITVTGVAESDSAVIRGVLQVSAEDDEDAEQGLKEFWVDVDELAQEIYVATAQPRETGGRNYVVNYEIAVPKYLAVMIENVNGNISVAAASGRVAVQNANGNVTLDRISGSAAVQVANGRVNARVFTSPTGTIRITTGNGSIDLAIPELTSATLLVTVGNGKVNVVNLDVQDPIRTATSFLGQLGTGTGLIRLATGNGSVTVVGF